MSPGQGAAVFVELYTVPVSEVASRQQLHAICLSSSASTDPTISSQNIRPSGFCCGWPDVLELTGRWTANLSVPYNCALVTALPCYGALEIVVFDWLIDWLICNKAASRIYFLKQLKRSSVDPDDLYDFYTTVIKPILEYACPVWHSGLMV